MGSVKLNEDLVTLGDRIDTLRSRGEICAPDLFATAEVEVAIAQHHARRGHGMVAADHVVQAYALTDETSAQTAHPDCATIMDEGDSPKPQPPPAVEPPIIGGEPGFPVIPLPPPLPAPPPANVDSDGDGIIDAKDQCPMVAGSRETMGCAPDSDGDGLPDDKDRCPSEVGSPDAGGCPYRFISLETIRIKLSGKINFRSANRKIASESVLILDEITVALKDRPRMRLRITGHTDSHGSSSSNQSVARKRAETVRRYLMKNGIDGDRLITIGYGESQPIDDNTTEAGRETNRRIEFHILKDGPP